MIDIFKVYLKNTNNEDKRLPGGVTASYYINLININIAKKLKSCGINHSFGEFIPSKNPKESIILSFKTNNSINCIPCKKSGLSIYFNSGNPESKMISEIIFKHFKNIYYNPSSVNLVSSKSQKSRFYPECVISLGFNSNKKDLNWICGNIDKIAGIIAISICEFFGLPFVHSNMNKFGIVKTSTSAYSRPIENSKLAFSCKQNQKVHICGQWETWYIVEKNNSFGYIPTKYFVI